MHKIIITITIFMASFSFCFADNYKDYNAGYLKAKYDSKKSYDKEGSRMLFKTLFGFYMGYEWGIVGLASDWLTNAVLPAVLYPAPKLVDKNSDYTEGYQNGYAEVQNQKSVQHGLYGSVAGYLLLIANTANQ